MISREWHAWGSGNPGTRQPSSGLGRATVSGGYLPRSAGMRARGHEGSRPVDSRRSRRTPTPNSHALLQWAMAGLRAATSLPRDRHTGTKTKTLEKNGKQNGVKGRRLRLGLVFCHGAHTREEQEHADEDINSNNNI